MEPLLTVEQVAKLLGLSPAWVYQHASGSRRPRIPCVKFGRSVRFRRESIEEFVREMEQWVSGQPPPPAVAPPATRRSKSRRRRG